VRAFEGVSSLTMSYFHTGIRTIIGAESFHCPVRDGKEWDQLAMVIRLELLSWLLLGQPGEFAESRACTVGTGISFIDCAPALH
jgi:hypothetical protein